MPTPTDSDVPTDTPNPDDSRSLSADVSRRKIFQLRNALRTEIEFYIQAISDRPINDHAMFEAMDRFTKTALKFNL